MKRWEGKASHFTLACRGARSPDAEKTLSLIKHSFPTLMCDRVEIYLTLYREGGAVHGISITHVEQMERKWSCWFKLMKIHANNSFFFLIGLHQGSLIAPKKGGTALCSPPPCPLPTCSTLHGCLTSPSVKAWTRPSSHCPILSSGQGALVPPPSANQLQKKKIPDFYSDFVL